MLTGNEPENLPRWITERDIMNECACDDDPSVA